MFVGVGMHLNLANVASISFLAQSSLKTATQESMTCVAQSAIYVEVLCYSVGQPQIRSRDIDHQPCMIWSLNLAKIDESLLDMKTTSIATCFLSIPNMSKFLPSLSKGQTSGSRPTLHSLGTSFLSFLLPSSVQYVLFFHILSLHYKVLT